MNTPLIITSQDTILKTLSFKPYRENAKRRVEPFLPGPNESQTMEIITPWGAKLIAKSGDFLVSELNTPDDCWPVNSQIFDESYKMIRPGFCVKRAVTLLVPLTDLTNGDEDQMVIIHTIEGSVTVRAGDFFLAKGVKGEIWPYPKAKAAKMMKPVN